MCDFSERERERERMKYRRTKINDEGNSSKQKYHWLDNHP